MNRDILFVCTGNTCRSPMAMAIFNTLSKEMRADSAGLQVAFPSGAAKNARIAVQKYGTSLGGHTSRQLTVEDMERYSLIITMTASQKQMLRTVKDDDKIITLAEFAGESADVSDPFGGSLELYEMTAEMIYNYIKKGLAEKTECAPAQISDTEIIVQLEKDSFPDAWSEKTIEREIENQRIIVIKTDGKISGYCIFMLAADEGEILRIAIDKGKRKCGLGKKLITAVIKQLGKMGCRSIFLEVRASNEAAISLYKSVEFEKTGIRKGYYRDNGEDALLFKLEIKER